MIQKISKPRYWSDIYVFKRTLSNNSFAVKNSVATFRNTFSLARTNTAPNNIITWSFLVSFWKREKEVLPELNVLKEARNRNVYDPKIHYPFFLCLCRWTRRQPWWCPITFITFAMDMRANETGGNESESRLKHYCVAEKNIKKLIIIQFSEIKLFDPS